ncbi:Gfo/Idh/MocA family protein [Celeribacter indicus]|uniref:Putative oxidoreductase n=1 Tax=Celeribacter indicus TaxID=1208324 RepID=A0A0B5E3P9_9RHOB|nr:Gfo/Idh/MocA family oxidoreductase [Celeribacter indicus]AJE48005.1 putative oxidoreductase [Celeribacter indicus]SDW29213.1 Predicted dehydrogenase [Celeribacter indicus]
MTQPLRFGILGAANFAREHMARAIHEAEGAELVALATTAPEKAAPFLAFAPRLEIEPGYDALLARPDIDAVYIPLPNHMHVDWSLRALEAGKHVLCEKPIAMRAADIDRLIAKRDETGLLCAEAFMIVHHPQWQRARALIAAGEIGRLLHVDVAFSFNNPDPDNIRNKAALGGGVLGDIGVYAFGCARFATGEEPEEITSTRIVYANDVDVTAEVTARFPSFAYHGYVSMRMAPYQQARFHGERGVITLRTPFNAGVYGLAAMELRAASGRIRRKEFPTVRQYVLQVEAFVRSATEGAAYPWTLEEAQGTQAMIDRVLEADQGK